MELTEVLTNQNLHKDIYLIYISANNGYIWIYIYIYK